MAVVAGPRRTDEAVLDAVARGVLGESYSAEVPARMRAKLDQFPSADRRRLLGALRALNTLPGAMALTGRPVPVSRLGAPAAESLMQRWLRSGLPPKRQLARALIALSTFAAYGYPGSEWERIGYPGPLGPAPDEPRPLRPRRITSPSRMTCDVVVVGSGAGGACAAGRLAEAGFDVVVLEKGGYQAEADFSHLEADALSRMFLYGGTLATNDLDVLILAGSTLGGGTVVNYTTSFPTPDFVLKEWAARTEIDAFVSGEFAESLAAVSRRVGVNVRSSSPGRRDVLLETGLRRLGWHVDAIPRAVIDCTQDDLCGYCGFGCRSGAKQSAVATFLQDAANHGARLAINADVRKVIVDDGRAVGVQGTADGHSLVVRAEAVVAAGGAIETPALLLRSGLRGQVGRWLRLHPGTAVFAAFDEPVRPWTGTLQARYSREIRDMDRGYGPVFESVPVHPGLGSGAMPWVSSRQHRELMGRFPHLGMCAVLPRDRTAGTVGVTRDGSVRVRYRQTPDDERRVIEGLVGAARVMEAAGATEIFTLHSPPLAYRPGPRTHDRWAEELFRTGLRGKVTGFSFHQMGTCRMGTDPATSAIGPDNESHEVKGLFVVDASAFPTASGVNPMLTIYGIANRAAGKIAARLT